MRAGHGGYNMRRQQGASRVLLAAAERCWQLVAPLAARSPQPFTSPTPHRCNRAPPPPPPPPVHMPLDFDARIEQRGGWETRAEKKRV
jgi:hypothetical protein